MWARITSKGLAVTRRLSHSTTRVRGLAEAVVEAGEVRMVECAASVTRPGDAVSGGLRTGSARETRAM